VVDVVAGAVEELWLRRAKKRLRSIAAGEGVAAPVAAAVRAAAVGPGAAAAGEAPPSEAPQPVASPARAAAAGSHLTGAGNGSPLRPAQWYGTKGPASGLSAVCG
jgi:hypothetical protein